MAADPQSGEISREELLNTISMFEQILEVMPGDELALRTLYDAYSKKGDRARAFDLLGQLTDHAARDKEPEAAEFCLLELAKFEGDFKDKVQAATQKLRQLKSSAKEKAPARAEETKALTDISNELSLAWTLFQDEQITQDDYSNVLHDLTEMSSKNVGMPVTVLHVLNDRSYTHFTRIMTYMATHSAVPIVSLSNFDVNEQLGEELPLDFIAHHGAIPFGKIGTELLVGVLNPFDKELLQSATKLCGKPCHPFLVLPTEYDALLARYKKAHEAKAVQ